MLPRRPLHPQKQTLFGAPHTVRCVPILLKKSVLGQTAEIFGRTARAANFGRGAIWTLIRSAGKALAKPEDASTMKVPTPGLSAQNSSLPGFGVFQHNLPRADIEVARLLSK